jgi:hypothetical protein
VCGTVGLSVLSCGGVILGFLLSAVVTDMGRFIDIDIDVLAGAEKEPNVAI